MGASNNAMTGGPYEFWLLDLDGTIVDVEADYRRRVIERIGDRLGVSFGPRTVEPLWCGETATRRSILADHGVDPDAFWRAYHAVEQPDARARATYRFPDATTITELDAPVGVVTHCQRYLTDPVLARLEMTDWFDAVVCCSDETGWKPDPDPIQHAMAELPVERSDPTGAYVGDSPDDMTAARAAGLDAVFLDRQDQGTACPDAIYRISRLSELPRLG